MLYNYPIKKKCFDCVKFYSDTEFSVQVSVKGWNGVMEYSTDRLNWNIWDGTSVTGKRIFFRGTNNTVVAGDTDIAEYQWVLTGENIECKGNIETLLDYTSTKNGVHPRMDEYCFACMFMGATNLLSAPDLPSPILSDFCYACMFWDCQNLRKAPKLHAMELGQYCYYGMFHQCYQLVEGTSLPATILKPHCYNGMFEYCRNMITIPKLPATNLTEGCYYAMLFGCKQLKFSKEKKDNYTQEYKIPYEVDGVGYTDAMKIMLGETDGAFIGTPVINTVYYLDSAVVII